MSSSSSHESESRSGSGSESESEYESVSEPNETESVSVKKLREKGRAAESVSNSTKQSKKQVGVKENENNKQSKKNKQHVVDENAMQKRTRFEKIWSDEDEIALLQGAIQYVKEKGVEPNSNTQDFHNFVSSDFQRTFRESQVRDKLRRLKIKYFQNIQRNGKGKSLSSPHEKAMFELSKIVWLNNSPPPSQAPPLGSDTSKFTEFLKSSNFSFGESFIREYTELTSNPEKNQQLRKKWLKLAIQEIELFRMKCDLVNEEAGAFLETLRSHYNK